MIIDAVWVVGAVAGLGWGLLGGFILGAFFVVKLADESVDDQRGDRS
jgi:hypothetical protein